MKQQITHTADKGVFNHDEYHLFNKLLVSWAFITKSCATVFTHPPMQLKRFFADMFYDSDKAIWRSIFCGKEMENIARKQIRRVVRVGRSKFTLAGYNHYGLNCGEHERKPGIWYREWALGARVGSSCHPFFCFFLFDFLEYLIFCIAPSDVPLIQLYFNLTKLPLCAV